MFLEKRNVGKTEIILEVDGGSQNWGYKVFKIGPNNTSTTPVWEMSGFTSKEDATNAGKAELERQHEIEKNR